MKNYKVGLGFDVHKFSKKKKDLVLGGVLIPSSCSLQAVSDGDVLLHAISDALLGAAGLGDIGDYFPPSVKASKNLDSKEIVKFILKKIKPKLKIVNIDTIIVADKPRLIAHKKKILMSLKAMFNLNTINVKIKSKERLGILGTKNSISCFCIALLKRK